MNNSSQQYQGDLLERLCEGLRNTEVPELKSDPLMPWEEQMSQNSDPREISSHHLRFRSVKVVLAAVAITLVVAGTTIIPGMLGSSVAFAQVQSAVERSQSVRFRILDFHGDKDPMVSSVVKLSNVGSRSDGPGGSESIVNLRDKRMLLINHRERSATIYQMYSTDFSKTKADEFFRRLRNPSASEVKALPGGLLDGVRVERYEVQNDGTFVVSVDPLTKLPVRMELSIENGLPGGKRFREVLTDFVFDTPIDEKLFAIEPPSDYTVRHVVTPEGRAPLDVSKIAVSPENGFGNIPLGSSKDEIIRKLGQPDSIVEYKLPSGAFPQPTIVAKDSNGNLVDGNNLIVAANVIYTLQYPSFGFDLTVGSNGLTRIHCYGRSSRGDLARDFLGHTGKGIRIGDSIDDLLAKHGVPEVRSKFRELSLQYFHAGYQFVLDDLGVKHFTVEQPVSDEIEIKDNGDGTWTQSMRAK